MAKIERFEDLKCWQEARVLVKEVYLLCEKGKLVKDFDTRSQLRRAALSVMNNIAEGFGKYSNKELIRYLDVANNSASEAKSILYVLIDLNYFPEAEVGKLQAKAEEVKSLCLALIKYLVKRNQT
ncbi:MAG: four helix bundle protein [Flammeovirgaceae bacterium]|nr:four helix bundle protein [Flammeovirgaceae bacterium]